MIPFGQVDAPQSFPRASSNGAAILEKRVSDRGTLEDLSQSRIYRSICGRKLLILNRRDAGAVDQARLESDSGDAHEVTLKHLAAHSIQLQHQLAPRRDAVNAAISRRFEAYLTQFLHSF